MGKLSGIISKISGSAGNITFKQRAGETIVSEKVTQVRNPRTTCHRLFCEVDWRALHVQLHEHVVVAERLRLVLEAVVEKRTNTLVHRDDVAPTGASLHLRIGARIANLSYFLRDNGFAHSALECKITG